EADGLRFGQRLHRAVDPEPVGVAVTVVRDEPEHTRLVFPDDRRRAKVLGVLEVAVAGGLDVEAAVGGQPARLVPVGYVQLDVGPSGQLWVADPEKRDVL